MSEKSDPAPSWQDTLPRYFSLALLAVLVVIPFFGPSAFFVAFAIELLIFSVFAMSLDLLMGYTGLVSLCHATFFGAGAYVSGLTALRISPEIGVILAITIPAILLLSVAIGWLAIRLSGFLFLMVTIAFGQMLYAVAYKWNWLTGGSDGIRVPPAVFLGKEILLSQTTLYYVALALCAVSVVVMQRIIRAPFGQALVGIRENTARMRAIGYNVKRYKLAAFVISAAFGGFAGILYVQYNLFVSPFDAGGGLSLNVLIMVLIGGQGTLVGPIIGAVTYLLVQNWLSSYTVYWNFIIGTLFVILMMFARKGLFGILRAGWSRLGGNSR